MALVDKYSKEELEKIVKSLQTLVEVVDKLGYNTHTGRNPYTVKDRLDKLEIDYSNLVSRIYSSNRNEENIFIKDSTASQSVLRRWYLKGNYTEYKCSICSLEPIWQGKELTLILDHINGENHDDRLENLRWVCPNCNQQLPTTGFKQMRVENKLEKKYYCCDCNKEISKDCIRCKDCDSKYRVLQHQKELPVDRETLKRLIRTTSFLQIGKQFNISNNGIRRWCENFNLPRTKKEINSYSDQEWESI